MMVRGLHRVADETTPGSEGEPVTAPLLLASICAALLFQMGVGIALALWRRRRIIETSPAAVPTFASPALAGAWDGWRDFRVVRREIEDRAETQCSFYLEPVDGVPLLPFIPGQFLTFALKVPDTNGGAQAAERRLTRCYSLSDGPDPRSYRVTVKRVLSPTGQPHLPPGVCSNHFHDKIQVGCLVQVKAPAGRFVIDPDPLLPTVLIAGGIGITPLMSMLRGGLAAQPNRTVHLFYGARHGREHGFRKELEELARLHPNFHLNVVYSQPGPDDVRGRDFQHVGHVDDDLLRRTLPNRRHRFYVCGPPPMMASLIPALGQWGVLPDDIHHEAFGPASVGSAQGFSKAQGPSDAPSSDVMFRRSGRTLVWDGQDANLLDFAERHDLSVESGCRSGSCGTCETRVISGTVRYAEKPDHETLPGHCLLCVGTPEGALELEA